MTITDQLTTPSYSATREFTIIVNEVADPLLVLMRARDLSPTP